MGRIATILGEHNINLESAHASRQEQIRKPTAFVHMFIESACEKNIFTAISKIKKSKIIRGNVTVIRILGDA